MRRAIKFSLDLGNASKRYFIKEVVKQYQQGVNHYIDILSSQKKYILSNQEVKDAIDFLPEGYKQCAYNKAQTIQKTQRRKKKYQQLPIFYGSMDLDSRFLMIEKAKGISFDYVARISTLNKGYRAIIPFKSYEYANQYFRNWKLCKGGKIQIKEDGKLFLILTFERLTPEKKQEGKAIGIDIGIKKLMVDSDGNQYGKEIEAKINKIQRKQQGSKAFKKALRERDEYINREAKKLPFNKIKTIVLEAIKNIKKNTKKEKKFGKQFRSKFQRWTYSKLISRIKQISEASGVHYLEVAPAYTSQTCLECKSVHKENRVGEIFQCRNCGYTADADFVGAKNILRRFYSPQEYMTPGSMKVLETYGFSHRRMSCRRFDE